MAPARLTGAGTILHWILMCAPPAARAAGYVAYKEEKAAEPEPEKPTGSSEIDVEAEAIEVTF